MCSRRWRSQVPGEIGVLYGSTASRRGRLRTQGQTPKNLAARPHATPISEPAHVCPPQPGFKTRPSASAMRAPRSPKALTSSPTPSLFPTRLGPSYSGLRHSPGSTSALDLKNSRPPAHSCLWSRPCPAHAPHVPHAPRVPPPPAGPAPQPMGSAAACVLPRPAPCPSVPCRLASELSGAGCPCYLSVTASQACRSWARAPLPSHHVAERGGEPAR